jgi:hypothetical protein
MWSCSQHTRTIWSFPAARSGWGAIGLLSDGYSVATFSPSLSARGLTVFERAMHRRSLYRGVKIMCPASAGGLPYVGRHVAGAVEAKKP